MSGDGSLWDDGYRRSAAVEAVDLIHGHTMEFSNQPNVHRLEYDEAEIALADRRCPSCDTPMSYDDGAYYCAQDGSMGEDRCPLALRRYSCP